MKTYLGLTPAQSLVTLLLLVVFMLLWSAPSHAQSATRVTPCDPATPNNSICIQWAAVTTGTLGEALTGVTYRVEQKFGTGAYATVSASQAGLTYYGKNLAVGTYTFRVYANCTNVGCQESDPSNAASRDSTAVPIKPSAPVIIIAATIRANGPPIYRVIQTVTLKQGEVVFVAPAEMRPLFASR